MDGPKSNKQRRSELIAKRTARAEKRNQRLLASSRKGNAQHLVDRSVLVDITKLAPDGSYSRPDFVERGYYEDTPFRCLDCGKEEVWSATQQKWWYEVAKGNVWTTARLCRPCRRRERDRKNQARRIHLEGIAAKRAGDHRRTNR